MTDPHQADQPQDQVQAWLQHHTLTTLRADTIAHALNSLTDTDAARLLALLEHHPDQ